MILESLLPKRHATLFTLSWRMTGDLFSHALSAPSFMAGRFEVVARCPICSLPELSNLIDDLLSLPLVNRYLESLLARRGPEKGDSQLVSDVCLWLRMLRRLQKFDQLPCLSNWLET
jgi:hypothetical protein